MKLVVVSAINETLFGLDGTPVVLLEIMKLHM